MAEGGCNPLTDIFLEPGAERDWNCAVSVRGIASLAAQLSTSLRFVIVHARWPRGAYDPAAEEGISASRLRSLLAMFSEKGLRVVLIGPVPLFGRNALSCVVLSDRYGFGHEACTIDRSRMDEDSALWVAEMRRVAGEFDNVRFVEPAEIFCDATVCRPFEGDTVLYLDDSHVSASGADRIFKGFGGDFEWAAGDAGATAKTPAGTGTSATTQ